jgi:hypothetical protein
MEIAAIKSAADLDLNIAIPDLNGAGDSTYKIFLGESSPFMAVAGSAAIEQTKDRPKAVPVSSI